ncbi:hypothetical protein [Parasphingorhabdus cellanae]|uniref:Uncharacterized protein n=1 Tax=Parasphingorhabdus cellanae TaxID=2806553 RepID=A0ABX7T979_9SPHN|nr:hypothetical protein [Parasphingorhabdus cellanae]QTD57558.1 hypothetical protein J4G78_08585 [Parasphingorhabdus cellanae]
MENLIRKAEAVAARELQKTKAEMQAALDQELPEDVSVAETRDGIVVAGRGLGAEIIENNSLRDVAFLMRGVR